MSLIADGVQRLSDQSTLTALQRLMDSTRRAFNNFNAEFEAERFAFGFNKLKHEDIIKDIHENNEKLGTFLELTGELATLQDRPLNATSRSLPKHLLQYWRHAERLYTLLKHAWGCKCRDTHGALLWLQHRSSPGFEFRLLVTFSAIGAISGAGGAWPSQDLKIETAPAGTVTLPANGSPPASVTPPAQQQSLATSGKPSILRRARVK